MLDFDAEYGDHPPIPCRAFGDSFDLPGEMPALTTMFIERMRWMLRDDEDAEVDPDEMDRLIDGAFAPLVGQDRLDRWRAAGASRKKLGAFLGRVQRQYAEADTPGEAEPPAEGAPPSSTSSSSGG